MKLYAVGLLGLVLLGGGFCGLPASAMTNIFFGGAQTAILVGTNATSDSLRNRGYVFTYSLDKWWYPTIMLGPGTPTGRPISVLWPYGVEAQTLTAGSTGVLAVQGAATITISRVDGQPFDLTSFTGKLLGNTAGAGAAFEIMPTLNGNDGFTDPLTFDATGYAGNSFSYTPTTLTGFDTYHISLWMDFALTGLTLVDASSPPPELQLVALSANAVELSWPTNSPGFTLQQNPGLATTNWVDNTNAITIVGTNYHARVSITNSPGFFRLLLP